MPYASMIEGWTAFLNEPVPDRPVASNALLPIDAVARRQLRKRYQRVFRDGNRILADAQDEYVHALRIDCKKLRYAMEFFARLLPAKAFNKLIGQLKILQNDLGEFNDLSVQQGYLLQMAEDLHAGDARGKRALVAIGFLVENLPMSSRPSSGGSYGPLPSLLPRAIRRCSASLCEGERLMDFPTRR